MIKNSFIKHPKKRNLTDIFITYVIIIYIVLLLLLFFGIYIIFKNLKLSKKKDKKPKKYKYIDQRSFELHKPEINVFLENKLYWRNDTSLHIEKVKEEVRNYKNLVISFENKTDFNKRENPKISIIMTLYNQENYIKLAYASIQKQELKDIEIILVDDASTDNSSTIVKELMENDKRIVYIKNDINRKTFYSRNEGILVAKGEYILVIDPDDLLINNILIKAYETAKNNDLDIVQFYMLIGKYDYANLWREVKYKNGILHNNSEIRNAFYYCISRNLADKLVRREVYVKSVNFMRKDLYNEDYHINDDDTAYFGLVHFANTFGFLEQIGYFYYLKPGPSPPHWLNPKKMNINFRSIFNIMKYFYLQSDNNTLEKTYMPYAYFKEKVKKNYEKFIPDLTDGFDFILDVLNLYANSTYFNEEQKIVINDFKNKIINRQKQIKG